MTRYYLVGRVPVAYERREDGSVVLRAFNPLTRAFVTDARYYSEIERDDTGRVRELTPAEYEATVEALRAG